jgi:hypothetical protein
MAYQCGTSSVSGTGVGVDLAGDFSVAGVRGEAQTLLAQSTSPPKGKSVFWVPFLLAWLITGFILMMFVASHDKNSSLLGILWQGTIGSLAGAFGLFQDHLFDNSNADMDVPSLIALVAGLAIGFIKGARAERWNSTQFPQRIRQWSASWVCRRCGYSAPRKLDRWFRW